MNTFMQLTIFCKYICVHGFHRSTDAISYVVENRGAPICRGYRVYNEQQMAMFAGK